MNGNPAEVLLTFDVEDFVNERSMYSLYHVLRLLEKHDLKAIFFITGHEAEKLQKYPTIINLLNHHEIGFHSSSHSVRPTIFEYTDLESYKEAYQVSLARETSHINPLTGKCEKEGGIYALRNLFPLKVIRAFRSPGLCWSPPNIDAMADLGIKFDFSISICFEPFLFKGITFYPTNMLLDLFRMLNLKRIINSYRDRRATTVLYSHPDNIVNSIAWDSIYYKGNPKALTAVPSRRYDKMVYTYLKMESFFIGLKCLQEANVVKVTDDLAESPLKYSEIKRNLTPEKIYKASIGWPNSFFNYFPKYNHKHFLDFFDNSS
jgi:polysaccharide deacetylase